MSANLGNDIEGAFGLYSPAENTNYYQNAANAIYAPAREAAVSGIAQEKNEAEQESGQRNAIQGISGPMAVENQERNQRLVGEAGNRQLNALDEQGRMAVYTGAEEDRQEQIAMQTARENAILNGFKMGAGLLTGAYTGVKNMFNPAPDMNSVPFSQEEIDNPMTNDQINSGMVSTDQ